MRILSKEYIVLLLIGVFVNSCELSNSKSKSDNSLLEQTVSIKSLAEQKVDSVNKARQDSVSNVEEKERLEKAVSMAEKDLFSSLRSVDKDFGERNYSKIKALLKKNNTTPYQLYKELTEIFKTAKKKAISRALGAGLKERRYTDFISKIEDEEVLGFQAKYKMDDRLYICFRNNYCSCLGENSESYCEGNKCLLPNGEYWE